MSKEESLNVLGWYPTVIPLLVIEIPDDRTKAGDPFQMALRRVSSESLANDAPRIAGYRWTVKLLPGHAPGHVGIADLLLSALSLRPERTELFYIDRPD